MCAAVAYSVYLVVDDVNISEAAGGWATTVVGDHSLTHRGYSSYRQLYAQANPYRAALCTVHPHPPRVLLHLPQSWSHECTHRTASPSFLVGTDNVGVLLASSTFQKKEKGRALRLPGLMSASLALGFHGDFPVCYSRRRSGSWFTRSSSSAPSEPRVSSLDPKGEPENQRRPPPTPTTAEALSDISTDTDESAPSTSCSALPRHVWDLPSETTWQVRGSSYLTDGVKAMAAPAICQLVTAQVFLVDRHRPGLTERLLRGVAGTGEQPLRLPAGTRFVFSVYWRNPKASRQADGYQALLLHFASSAGPDDGDALIQELWRGDPEDIASRLKMIPNLREGPRVLKIALKLARAASMRPILLTKNLNGSWVHRAELPNGVRLVEVSVDINGPLCRSVYSAAIGAISSVDVALAFTLEGRTAAQLPERVLGEVRLKGVRSEYAVPLRNAQSKGEGRDASASSSSKPSMRRIFSMPARINATESTAQESEPSTNSDGEGDDQTDDDEHDNGHAAPLIGTSYGVFHAS